MSPSARDALCIQPCRMAPIVTEKLSAAKGLGIDPCGETSLEGSMLRRGAASAPEK